MPPYGSGTAWLPAVTPLRGFHLMRGQWQIMIHGAVFGQFIRESGPRGNWQLGSVHWLMARADHPLGGGAIGLRAMISAEFLTLTRAGYPQLLQVAQPYRGGTLTDRMHPHELIGEAAVTYEHPLASGLAGSLYLGAAGEPALGPVTYLHRPSALDDPIAPLTHHAQDETHERFGVATIGLSTRRVRLEGSAFDGDHPDDVHTNLELSELRLNSFAARVTVNPSPQWSVSASGGYLAAPSSGAAGGHVHGAQHRYVLAVMNVRPRPAGVWATTLVWGANSPIGTGRLLPGILAETSFDVNARTTLFGRAEYATRTAEELNLVGSVDEQLGVGTTAMGMARRVRSWRGGAVWFGVRGSADFLPEQLRLFYGARILTGFAVYLQLRPPVLPDGR